MYPLTLAQVEKIPVNFETVHFAPFNSLKPVQITPLPKTTQVLGGVVSTCASYIDLASTWTCIAKLVKINGKKWKKKKRPWQPVIITVERADEEEYMK